MEATFQNAVTIAIVGFCSALAILILFALIITAINKLNAAIENKKQKTNPNDIDDETVAVITAAVITTMNEIAKNEKVVIKKMKLINPISSNTTRNNVSKIRNFQSHNKTKTENRI